MLVLFYICQFELRDDWRAHGGERRATMFSYVSFIEKKIIKK